MAVILAQIIVLGLFRKKLQEDINERIFKEKFKEECKILDTYRRLQFETTYFVDTVGRDFFAKAFGRDLF